MRPELSPEFVNALIATIGTVTCVLVIAVFLLGYKMGQVDEIKRGKDK